MEYRFTFTYDLGGGETSTEVEEPEGMPAIEAILKREWERGGVFFNYADAGLQLNFIGEAKDILEELFEQKGIDAQVRLLIELREDPLLDEWIIDYEGFGVFESRIVTTDYFGLNFEDSDLWKVIQSNNETRVAADRATDLDGNPITPTESIPGVVISPRNILHESAGNLAGLVTPGVPFFSYVLLIGPNNIFTWLQQDLEENNNSIRYRDNSRAFDDSADVISGLGGNTIVLGGLLYGRKNPPFSYDLNLTLQVNLEILEVSMDPGTNIRFIITRQEITDPSNPGVETDVAINTWNTGDPAAHSFTLQYIESNIRFQEYVFTCRVEGNMVATTEGVSTLTINILEGIQFDFRADTVFEYPSKGIGMYYIHDVLDHNIGVISGQEGKLYSEFLGRTALGYAEDGPGAYFAETGGFQVRRATGHSYVNSFKDRLDSLRSIFNLGASLERSQTAQVDVEVFEWVTLEGFHQVQDYKNIIPDVDKLVLADLLDTDGQGRVERFFLGSLAGVKIEASAVVPVGATVQISIFEGDSAIGAVSWDNSETGLTKDFTVETVSRWYRVEVRMTYDLDTALELGEMTVTTTSRLGALDVIRVEHFNHFFANQELGLLRAIEVDSYEEEFFEPLMINKVIMGYDKFFDIEESPGAFEEVHTSESYTFPQFNITGKEAVFLSKYAASDILWSEGMRVAFDEDKTRGWKYDNDAFIIELNSNGTQRHNEEMIIEGPTFPLTAFNARLNCRFNMFNHASVLGSIAGFKKIATDDIDMTNFLNNAGGYSYQYAGGATDKRIGDRIERPEKTIGLSDDIILEDYAAEPIEEDREPRFDPILIRFSAGLSQAAVEVIKESQRNGLFGRNYGFIRFVRPDLQIQSGWILSVRYNNVDKIAKFELIARSGGLLPPDEGPTRFRLLEDNDLRLLEDGDRRLLEDEPETL